MHDALLVQPGTISHGLVPAHPNDRLVGKIIALIVPVKRRATPCRRALCQPLSVLFTKISIGNPRQIWLRLLPVPPGPANLCPPLFIIVAAVGNKSFKLGIGDRVASDEKRRQCQAMLGLFIVIGLLIRSTGSQPE